jgi:hypothetical protein
MGRNVRELSERVIAPKLNEGQNVHAVATPRSVCHVLGRGVNLGASGRADALFDSHNGKRGCRAIFPAAATITAGRRGWPRVKKKIFTCSRTLCVRRNAFLLLLLLNRAMLPTPTFTCIFLYSQKCQLLAPAGEAKYLLLQRGGCLPLSRCQ